MEESLNKFKVQQKESTPNRRTVEVFQGKLYFKTIDYRNAPQVVKDDLAYIIYFAQSILGFNKTNTFTSIERDLGDKLRVNNKQRTKMDEFIRSARTTTGLTGGTNFIVGHLNKRVPACALLIALRALRKYGPQYRKVGKKGVHPQIIKGHLNSYFGLRDQDCDSLVSSYLKQILNIACSSDKLPAAFHAAAKSQFDYKTKDGLMSKLGYTPVRFPPEKLLKLAKLRKVSNKNGIITKLNSIAKDDDPVSQDTIYHSCAKMITPLLSEELRTENQTSFKDQLSLLELSDSSRRLMLDHQATVDEFGKAYAFYAAHLKAPNKTKAASVWGQLRKATGYMVDRPYVDSQGGETHDYMDLPLKVRRFLEALMKRKPSPAVKVVEPSSDDDDNLSEEGSNADPLDNSDAQMEEDPDPSPDRELIGPAVDSDACRVITVAQSKKRYRGKRPKHR